MKRRSATKPSRSQPEPTFFTDRRAVVKAGVVHPEAKVVLTAEQWSDRNRRMLPEKEDEI